MNSDEKLQRTWRQIAREAADETDEDKAVQLAQELLRALDEHIRPLDANVARRRA